MAKRTKTKIYTEERGEDGQYIYQIHPRVTDYLQQYFELPLGTSVTATPYFMNTGRRKDLRSLVGKGTPEEITLETKVWAKVRGLDLATATPEQVRTLQLAVGIGVDCSGFVLHGLQQFFLQVRHRSLVSQLRYRSYTLRSRLGRWLRPIENVGAYDLTADVNTEELQWTEVRPGDLLRGIGKQRNAYHVAIVTRVVEKLGKIAEIEYWHSHSGYGQDNGVRKGHIFARNYEGSLLEQDWQDLDANGKNDLVAMDIQPFPLESGFRRLHVLQD